MYVDNKRNELSRFYIMRPEDIGRFADTLADGFSEYSLFWYICGGKNVREKMRLFWTISLTLAQRYKTRNDGYLLGFATRLDMQGQHYGSPLVKALLNHLDALGEGCYLETMKAENVALYQHFSFQLKEQPLIQSGHLTLFAMHRPGKSDIP